MSGPTDWILRVPFLTCITSRALGYFEYKLVCVTRQNNYSTMRLIYFMNILANSEQLMLEVTMQGIARLCRKVYALEKNISEKIPHVHSRIQI